MKMNKIYKPQRFTDRELMKIFPEAKEIIPIKIQEWQKVSNQYKRKLKRFLVSVYRQNADEFTAWYFEQVAKCLYMEPLLAAEKHILRLKRVLLINGPEGNNLEYWQEKIEIARHYPIEELARSKLNLRQTGKNFVSLCPFHSERTPSFFIYPETNRYHCFGCQESGDVIKLTMQIYGINFKEAIQILNN